MNNRFLALSLAIALTVSGFSSIALAQVVTVAITAPANGATLVVGQPAVFTAQATGGSGAYSYVWAFGDNTSGAGPTSVKTYNTVGDYAVTVTATETGTNQGSANITVHVVAASGDTQSPSAPVITSTSTTANSATVNWSVSTDNIGVVGYSYEFDQNPNTSPNSSVDTTNLTATQTNLSAGIWYFHIVALDAAGNRSTVTHSGPLTVGTTGTTLAISNVRVTDITSTSVIVRWETNLPASSRVIYDTASHASLGTAPNYGYANSTTAIDVAPNGVTTHAVTVSGLSPATTYYFRAISQ